MRAIAVVSLLMALAAPALAQDITYRTHISPLMEAKCAACHGADAPYYGDFNENKKKFEAQFKGPRMDTYPNLIFSSSGLTPAPS